MSDYMRECPTGASGGVPFNFNSTKPPTQPQGVNAQGGANRVADLDVTRIANDEPGDGDYDDPYPGGPTSQAGLPLLPYG